MRISRPAITCVCLWVAACSKADDADFIGSCELRSASLQLSTQDAGNIIAAATVEGCQATILRIPTCSAPAAALEAYSTSGGGPPCVFKVYSTDGRVFVGSSTIENVKLVPGYKCKTDHGAVFDVDSYFQFSPSSIFVDFESVDAGSVDAQACAAPDGGTRIDAK